MKSLVVAIFARAASCAVQLGHEERQQSDLTRADNPLAGLPALPKIHWSWPRALAGRSGDCHDGLCANDSAAILKDYGRITHSLPLSLARQDEDEWDESVQVCAEVNCTLALNWSPWYSKMPGKMGPADPTYIGPEEKEEMALFQGTLNNASALVSRLNARHGASVKVGALLIDSEKYEFCDHHNDSATNKPYDTCSDAVWHALTRKNNLVFDACKQTFPTAFVLQYDRGGMNGCGLFPNNE